MATIANPTAAIFFDIVMVLAWLDRFCCACLEFICRSLIADVASVTLRSCTKRRHSVRHKDSVAEWLRRWIANPLLFERESSNLSAVDNFFHHKRMQLTEGRKIYRMVVESC